MNVITLDAVVYKVETLVDGGLRVASDLPEDAIDQAAKLMQYKRNETVIRVAITSANATAEQPARKRKKGQDE